MAATRHEARGTAREPDGGTPRCPNIGKKRSAGREQVNARQLLSSFKGITCVVRVSKPARPAPALGGCAGDSGKG